MSNCDTEQFNHLSNSIYPLQQRKLEPRPKKICYLLETNSIFHPARSREMNAKDSAGCWSWLVEKEKHSETHSNTVRGQSNLTVGEHDSQKCERKLIEFEGTTQLNRCLEGKDSSRVPVRVRFSKGVSAREERRGEEHISNRVINYDVLIDGPVVCSSHQQSSEKIPNSANKSSIPCCHLVAKLC